MGMNFPAGKAMDGLLEDGKKAAYEESYVYKGSFKEGVMNLSGLENHLNMRLDRGDPLDHVAYATFRNVADVLEQAGGYFAAQAGVNHIFMTGGVCANSLIRTRLIEGWSKRGLEGIFCSKPDCTDNAVGNALIGLDHYKRSET
jgi:N6-L-threonylcarbamoyladenine synthase